MPWWSCFRLNSDQESQTLQVSLLSEHHVRLNLHTSTNRGDKVQLCPFLQSATVNVILNMTVNML